jgi:uncharacterized membrane protein
MRSRMALLGGLALGMCPAGLSDTVTLFPYNLTGINNNGAMVGWPYHQQNGWNGFLYQAGAYTPIAVPEAQYNFPTAINDNGEIVGYWSSSTIDGDEQNGFVYIGGKYTTLDYPGAAATQLLGITDSGEILGSYTNLLVNGKYQSGSFLYNDGTFHLLPVRGAAINDEGEIAGSNLDSQDSTYTVDNHGTLTTYHIPLPNAVVTGFNDAGQVVGEYTVTGNTWGAFVAQGDKVISLTNLNTETASANAINDHGMIVGSYSTELYCCPPPKNSSAGGLIFTPDAVPEPSTLVLTAFPFVLLAVLRKRYARLRP